MSRDQVAFEMDGERTVVEPTLHLDEPPPGKRSTLLLISGVGSERPPKPAGCVLRLFYNDAIPPEVRAQKEEYLGRFFRFCVELLVRKAIFMVKPMVTVHGADQLDEHTGGYSRALLRYALQQAGAREVVFA